MFYLDKLSRVFNTLKESRKTRRKQLVGNKTPKTTRRQQVVENTRWETRRKATRRNVSGGKLVARTKKSQTNIMQTL